MTQAIEVQATTRTQFAQASGVPEVMLEMMELIYRDDSIVYPDDPQGDVEGCEHEEQMTEIVNALRGNPQPKWFEMGTEGIARDVVYDTDFTGRIWASDDDGGGSVQLILEKGGHWASASLSLPDYCDDNYDGYLLSIDYHGSGDTAKEAVGKLFDGEISSLEHKAEQLKLLRQALIG